MDMTTASYLSSLDERFYETNAASFSQTRHGAWKGWERLAGILQSDAGEAAAGRPLDVLDFACGNMRFLGFLQSALPGREIRYWGVDSCDALVPERLRDRYRHRDIVSAIIGQGACDGEADGARSAESPHPAFDLVACFGFMHHVPGHAARERLLQRLVESACPGGFVAVSFWRFMDDARLAAKAQDATSRALAELPPLDLDDGDYFLGWQGGGGCRYCHHFDTAEIDALVASVRGPFELVERYRADGRTGTLNEYLVYRRAQ